MEETLEAIVDGLTSVLLVFEETQADPNAHMVVNSTAQIAAVIDNLASIAPDSVRGAPDDFKRSAGDLVTELLATKQTIDLFSDRKLSKDEGAIFIAAIKHLLKTAVRVLKLQEDSRVAIVFMSGRTLSQTLRKLHGAEDSDVLPVARQFNDDFVHFTMQLSERIDAVSSQEEKKRLEAMVEVLKQYPAQVIITTKAKLQNPSTENYQKFDDTIVGVVETVTEIITVITKSQSILSTFDLDYYCPGGGGYRKPIDPALALKLRKTNKSLEAQMSNLSNKQHSKDIDGISAVASEIEKLIREQIENGRLLAEKVDDEEKKSSILKLARALEHLLPQFALLTKEIIQSPEDPEIKAEYEKIKANLKSLSNQLAMCSLNAEMDFEVQKLIEALNLKNHDAALDEGKKLAEHMAEQASLAKLVANGLDEGRRKAALLTNANALEKNSSNLVPAIVAAKNGDTNNVHLLNQTIMDIQTASDNIINEGIRPAVATDVVVVEDLPKMASALEKAIVSAGIEIVELLDRYWVAARGGNEEGAREIWERIKKLVEDHLRKVDQFVSLTNDPALTKNLREAADRLRPLLKELEGLGTKPSSTAQISSLRSGYLKAKRGVNDISLRTREISDGRYAVTASKARQVDKRVPTDLASLLLGLNSYTSVFGNASPQALLVNAAKAIAAEMESVMVSMKEKNKGAMVNFARAVNDKMPDFIKLAVFITNSCPDPVMKGRLEALVHGPKNFAVQLKIIASVKAAHDDDTAEHQMNAVMKQLTKSLQNVVEAADSVTLLK